LNVAKDSICFVRLSGVTTEWLPSLIPVVQAVVQVVESTHTGTNNTMTMTMTTVISLVFIFVLVHEALSY
jgi:hypothetical protein